MPAHVRLPSSPWARRLVQLYVGLLLYGVSMAVLVRSGLGVMPWDVLHQGLARQLSWSLGSVTVLVGALVLLAWIPLRERPGLGTVSNVVVIGLAVDAALRVLPEAPSVAAGLGFVGVASCSTPSPRPPTSGCASDRALATD